MKNFYSNISKDLKFKTNSNFSCDLKKYEFKLKSLQKKSNKCLFSGYASVFNIVDFQNDIILPGAFSKTIQEKKKILLLWQHNPDFPIGKITNLKEDEKGLHICGEIILELKKGLEVYQMLKHEILDSFSIGYTPLKFSYKKDNSQNSNIRVIKELKLWEISMVTFGANYFARVNNFHNNSEEHYDLIENHYYEDNYNELYDYVFNQDKDEIINENHNSIPVEEIKKMIEKFRS